MDLTDIRSLARRLLGLVALASLGVISAGEVGCSGGASGGDGGASDGSGSDDTGGDIKDGPYTVGPVSGKVSGLPDSCSQPDTYVFVKASSCPFIHCRAGSPVYALCIGGSYSACDCSLPSGYAPVQQ
jgi:hypothetical protein